MSKDFKRVILIVQRISPVQQKLKKKVTEKWSQNSEKTVVISWLGYKE